MATVEDLVQATRGHLFAAQNEELNRLNTAMSASAITADLEFAAAGIKAGVTIAIDLEEMHVWSVAGSQVTVQRGMNGSVQAEHDAKAVITVKPKFSNFRIYRALQDDLLDLSAPGNDLFQVLTLDLTYQPSTTGYDLSDPDDPDNPPNILDIHEVRYKTLGPSNRWPRIRNFEIARGMDTDQFPSGMALILHESAHPGLPIRVKYKAPFTPFGLLFSDPVSTGLAPSMLDLPPLGAAIRLMSGRDIKRSFTENQGEPRRADEVRVGDAVTSMRGLLALRAQRIQAEAGRLQRLYPTQR